MQVHVRLTISDPRPEDAGSRVRAMIVDTARADALHPTVAETTVHLRGSTREVELVIDVPDEVLTRSPRLSLQAHIDRGDTGEIKAGDLIITQNVPVPSGGALPRARIDAPLTRI